MLEDKCQIPADCLVLSTEDSLGQCYINTSQLDGERNLKPKLAPKITQANFSNIIADYNDCDILIEVNDPIKDIYRFDGAINNFKAKTFDTLDLK